MTEPYKGREKRKYTRLNEKVSLLYRAGESADLDHLSKVTNSATKDISGGGFCFETEVYIPPNSILEVQINKIVDKELKAVLPIHSDARVSWIKQIETGKYRLGLQFISIEEKHRNEIIRGVKEKLKSS